MEKNKLRQMLRVKLRSKPTWVRIKHERFEKNWRNRAWREFSMTHTGRMSWPNWIIMKKGEQRRCREQSARQ